MVLALSAPMDLRAIADEKLAVFQPMTPDDTPSFSLFVFKDLKKKGGVESYGHGYLLFFTYLIMLSYGFVDVGRVHPV